ncbi:MAG TPA: HAMP domain-containing protein [Alphaproteobacteria bacterium]|nr:HAMP domain-containing protein [Alphaproteobacteria bacterium]
MRLSLGAKVQLGFFSAVALVVVIGVMAFIYLGRLNHEVQDVLQKDILFARAGEAIKIFFLETRRAEKNYLVFGQDRDIREYEFFLAKLKEALQEGKEAARKDETRGKYRAIEQHLQQYEQTFSRLLTVPPEARDEIRRVSQELGDIGQRIATLADEIADTRWAELEMHAQDADRIETVAKRNMGIILAFTGISSLLLGLYLPRKIVVPIRRLTDLIRRAQEEEFRVNIDVTSNDEIGELGRFINRMMDQIRVFDDLKVRKITEERRRLEVLANLLHEGVILVGDDGRVCYINPAALEFLGLNLSDVEGRPLKEVPLDEPLRQALLRSIDAHERFHDNILSLLAAERGTRVRKIALSTGFVRDENGEIMSIVCVFREVTNENAKVGAEDEVVKEVVEELAVRLRAALQAKEPKEDKEVG